MRGPDDARPVDAINHPRLAEIVGRYGQGIAASAVPMAIISTTGHVAHVNAPFADLIGRDADELIGTPVTAFVHEEDLPFCMDAMTAMASGAIGSYTGEHRYRRMDSGVTWATCSLHPIHDRRRHIVGFFAQAQDMTERRRTEERLRDAQERFRSTLEHLPIGIAVLDMDGRFLEVNDALCDITGVAREELLKEGTRSPLNRTHPEPFVQQLIAGELRRFRVEHYFTRRDGRAVWVAATVGLDHDPTDNTPCFVVAIEDITDRKSAERERDEAEKQLRRLAKDAGDQVFKNERRFRLLAEASSDITTVLDAKGHVVDVLPSVIYNFGYGIAEVLEQSAFDFVHPDDQARARAEFIRRLQVPGRHEPFLARMLRSDGAWRWMSLVSTNLLDDPDVRGVVVNARDVTQELETARLLESNEQRFRSLVQNAHDIVAIVDMHGIPSYVSPSMESVLGYSRDEWTGSFADLVHPEDAEFLYRHFSRDPGPDGRFGRVEFRSRHKDGSWRWLEAVITDRRSDPTIGGLVVNARDVTERNRALHELERLANFDDVTGLANRRHFRALLAARLYGRDDRAPLAVVSIGVPIIDAISTTFGFEYSDEVIRQAAARLRAEIGQTGIVGRIGNELLLALDTPDGPEAGELPATLHALFRQPVSVKGQPFRLDAVLGMALFPTDGREGDLLQRRAASARVRAMQAATGWAIYTKSLDDAQIDHVGLLADLAQALENDELDVHYQPQVDARTGGAYSVEALLRWRHEARGQVSPAEFIPVAENSGLIKPLTRWVLEAAIRQAADWHRAGQPVIVAVNVTARNLQDPTFAHEVASMLAREKLPPDLLCLELTERSVLTEPVSARLTCERLHKLGVRLSLDDFGAGQSGLAYLSSLPIDEVKIDQIFVRDATRRPAAAAIVRAIVDIATSLRMRVVGEGVETAEMRDDLLALGCRHMQGYLFARPLPAAELTSWLTGSTLN